MVLVENTPSLLGSGAACHTARATTSLSTDPNPTTTMKILVTGATGVVGRRVVPLLTAAGHDVVAAGRDPVQRARLERAGARVVALDLFDPAAVRSALDGRDVLVNLATHIPSSSARMMLPGAWRENDRLRRDATAIMARAAIGAGVGRWIQESFAPLYADGGDRWIDEQWPMRPARYNRTVLDAERAVATFAGHGGTGVVLRFAGFYGPDARHVTEMLGALRRGWFPLPGAPDAYWSSISPEDAATAVVAALGAAGGTYNASDDEPLVRRELAEAMARAFGLRSPKLPPSWMPRLMGSLGEALARSQRMSNARLRALGWAPRYRSAREGFAAAAAGMGEQEAA